MNDAVRRAQTRSEAVRALLADPGQQFTRDQVADLLGAVLNVLGDELTTQYHAGWIDGSRAATREGDRYERAQADGRARAAEMHAYRASCDAEARRPRPADHRGGPVEVWPATRPDPTTDAFGNPVRWIRDTPYWRV